MLSQHPRKAFLFALFAVLVVTRSAGATPTAPTKDQCVDAHSRGQDARESGKLALARELFITCGQQTCPALIQADCARYGEDIGRLLPTVTFAARDARMNDLPNTYVYVDDALLTTRLDDGRAYEVDPGHHAVRFVHEGTETTLHVVVTEGEKGRQLVAQFAGGVTPPPPVPSPSGPAPAHEPSRPLTPLLLSGLGLVAGAGGAVLIVVGYGKVPSGCSTSTHECLAPPGDASFDQAKSGITMVNVGLASSIAGAALIAGGVIWYLGSSPVAQRTGKLVTPWVDRSGGGLAVAGAF